MTADNKSIIFDYRALRLLIGIIAFSLPFVATLLATTPISSISASYYTEARDAFVGMLFVVGAFLLAYNGHTTRQKIASKVAAFAAVGIAVFPTACDMCNTSTVPVTCLQCETTYKSVIHFISAGTLFSILAYFCLGPFREKTKRQPGKKGRRAVIYLACGVIMLLSMLAAVLSELPPLKETFKGYDVIYWVELVALCAFGVAWIVAGKYLSPLVDAHERLT